MKPHFTMTLNLSDSDHALVEDACKSLEIPKSEFIRRCIRFTATANAVWNEHPQTDISICGPKAFPKGIALNQYGWCPLWGKIGPII